MIYIHSGPGAEGFCALLELSSTQVGGSSSLPLLAAAADMARKLFGDDYVAEAEAQPEDQPSKSRDAGRDQDGFLSFNESHASNRKGLTTLNGEQKQAKKFGGWGQPNCWRRCLRTRPLQHAQHTVVLLLQHRATCAEVLVGATRGTCPLCA